jgi:CBS domain containing-hemolysin-like protein
MTPRVMLAALPADAGYDEVRALAEETRLTRLPVFEENIDHIVGLLPVRPYLLAGGADVGPLAEQVDPVHYVPETARLDQLLDWFRETQTQSAVAVDEFGGTAGIVAIEDVVEELVGDIVGADETGPEPPMLVGAGRWRVAGSLSVHEWAEMFGQRLVSPQVATIGGLIVSRLGRAPQPGDSVSLANVGLEVEQVEGARVLSVIVTLHEEGAEPAAGEGAGS